MINLFDSISICKNGDVYLDGYGYRIEQIYKIENLLKFKLNLGKDSHDLINVKGIRGIGKTYTLIGFAKENNYDVIVNTKAMKNILLERYNYENIFSVSDLKRGSQKIKNAVVDEGVNIQEVLHSGVNIVTGYISNAENYICLDKNKKENNIENNLISTLDKEIYMLLEKIQHQREIQNWGTYKNLIQALERVLVLKHTEEDKINSSSISMNMNIENLDNVAEQISNLEKQLKNLKVKFTI